MKILTNQFSLDLWNGSDQLQSIYQLFHLVHLTFHQGLLQEILSKANVTRKLYDTLSFVAY